MISIIIPAHDEESHLPGTLTALLEQAPSEGVEVLVVANGCRDRTADIARGFGPPVRVLESEVASKTAALNLGEQHAVGFPRVYVDADVTVRWEDVERLVAALDDPGISLVAPRRTWRIAAGTPWIVRSYLRAWSCLPQVRGGLTGRGVMAIDEGGRAGFSAFPDVVADDRFLESRVTPERRRVVAEASSIVDAPRTLDGLLSRRVRVARGNRELSESGTAVAASGLGSVGSILAAGPARWFDLPAFLAVTVMSRIRGRVVRDAGWERDESTRTAVADGAQQRTASPIADPPNLVSVIVPIHDAGAVLADQLAALDDQPGAGPFEVVLVDNGSADDSVDIARAWADARPHARVLVAAEQRGAGYARQAGVEAARGDLLAFTDADDVVDPGWVAAISEGARYGSFVKGIDLEDGTAHGDAAQTAPYVASPSDGNVFLPVARGGNMAVRADALREVGGWDGSVRRGQDTELSWRLQLAGHRLIVVPAARVTYRRPAALRDLLRHQFEFGHQAPGLAARFADAGAPPASMRGVLRDAGRAALRLPALLAGRGRRRRWLVNVAGIAGRAVGTVRARSADDGSAATSVPAAGR